MIKKLLTLSVSVVVLAMASAGTVAAAPKVEQEAVDNHKVTICHGTNSVTNPYTRPTVDDDAADGDTGNDKGQGDHSTHTGPVATSPEVAQQLKNSKVAWGDIIPPHDNYAGLNWTNEGQAIYFNNCEYVEPNFEQPLVTSSVDCAVINGEQRVVVVLRNDGLVDGSALVNGVDVVVPANSTVELDYASGTTVTIVVNRQTIFEEVVTCGGRGSEDPETPASADPQVAAPKAGVNAGAGSTVAIAAILLSSVASLAYGVFRLRKDSL